MNGGAANSAACAQDQNVFARLKLRASEEHMPGGLEYQRDRGGLFEAEIFRIRHAVHFRAFYEFGAAAVDDVAKI